MMIVRFVEGHFAGPIIYDLKMPLPPRAGETITLRLPNRTEVHYQVLAIEYVIDVPKDVVDISEDLKIVRVTVKEVIAT